MKGMKRYAALAVVAGLGLAGCEPIDDGGGGTAGGVFNSGFAFVRADRNVYVLDDKGDPSSPIPLTSGGGAQQPAVARNGRSIVFVRKVAGGAEIQTVPTVANSQSSAVFSSTDPQCTGCTGFRSPVFSPDGQSIVFVIERGTGAATSLGLVNANGSGFQELTPGTTLSYGAPSFYPDGQSVLAPAGNGLTNLTQLARVRLDGTAPAFFNSSLGNEARAIVNRAVVSPDGTKVAFDGEVSSGGSRIFVAGLTTQGLVNPVAVTAHVGSDSGARDTYPSWTGANQVGFSSNAGGADQVYRVSTNAASPGAGSLVVPSATEPFYGPI